MGLDVKNYAFIGDVHSQSKPLASALRYCEVMGLTPILLGDLFNSACDVSDSLGVLKLVLKAKREMGGIVLQSNHQRRIENHYKDPKAKVSKNVKRTVKDFEESGFPIEHAMLYMQSFPLAIAFKDSHGLEYRVAHAEFPIDLRVPAQYDGVWEYKKASSPEQEYMLLWGRGYDLPDEERFWWEWEDKEERDWVRVAGHYHKIVNTGKSLVLDAGCGGKTRTWYTDEPPKLALYDVERKELLEFEVF